MAISLQRARCFSVQPKRATRQAHLRLRRPTTRWCWGDCGYEEELRPTSPWLAPGMKGRGTWARSQRETVFRDWRSFPGDEHASASGAVPPASAASREKLKARDALPGAASRMATRFTASVCASTPRSSQARAPSTVVRRLVPAQGLERRLAFAPAL